jgi:hypothetical protein
MSTDIVKAKYKRSRQSDKGSRRLPVSLKLKTVQYVLAASGKGLFYLFLEGRGRLKGERK